MKRACLVSLLVWAGLSGAFYYYFHGRFTPPGDMWGSIAAGFFTGLMVGAISSALQARRDASRVATASGQMYTAPEHGQTLAVFGNVRALQTPLTTPFTHKPAIYYSYEIEHLSRTGNDTTWVKDYSGMALTPSVIDSMHGPVRILTFPALENFGKESYSGGSEEMDRAREYVRDTPFEKMSGLAVTKIIGEVKDLMKDTDGEIRKDWQMGDVDPTLDDHTAREEVILNGEQVCAIGKWSQELGALLPEADSAQVRIVRGAPQEVLSQLKKKSVSNVIVGMIVGLIANGVIYGVLVARESSPSVRRKAQVALYNAVEAGNLSEMRKAVDRGAKINLVMQGDEPMLFNARNEKTARWLIENGADINLRNNKGETPLIFHAADGRADVVKVLIEAHAHLDAADPEYQMTALERALHGERLEVIDLLRKAGAKDDTITAQNGARIDETHPAFDVVRKYLDAVFAEKPETLTGLSTFHFDGTDFATWKASRTNAAHMVSGFANENAATIVVRGPRVDGGSTTWTYQICNVKSAWRVCDERWETRLENQ
ncbi:MAG: ankyrin repeat domain-containing protein [Acidobacteria bacterium]|nr:ankyrin repeat domain-containing protein [Acidobacteriota bacterium]